MSSQVSKFKNNRFHLNIGFFIFLVIIIYVIFNIYSYATSKEVSEYEVVSGSIVSNHIYRGIAIRDESVVYAPTSGYINYYQTEGSKVSVKDLIYSIDKDGIISSAKNQAEESSGGVSLSKDTLSELSDSVTAFMTGYSSDSFISAVNYKNNLSTSVEQAVNNQILNQVSDEVASATDDESFYSGFSDTPGIIYYYMDGYEDLTTDTFSVDDLNAASDKVYLNTTDEIGSSDPVYKILNSENWNIILEIDQNVQDEMKEDSESYVKIRFCEDDYTVTVPYTCSSSGSHILLNLSLNKAMIRYASERFLDIELILSDDNGLKIPNSSIVEKEFYTIPTSYFTQGGDSSDYGLLVHSKDSESDDFVFVAPTIYYEGNDCYYIDSESVSTGDTVYIEGSSDVYTIGDDIDTLQGVYNINKGYAVFKHIEPINSNEEYTIVESKTKYGISLYDHIALDADTLDENELIAN